MPATCPRCHGVALDAQPLVRHCPRCGGSWVDEETLHARAAAAHARPPGARLPWRREARAVLGCAVCGDPMETLVVRDTPIDRCPRHGLWFDARELARVLAPVAAVAVAAVAAERAAAAPPERGSTATDAVEVAAEIGVELAVANPAATAAVAEAGLEAAAGAGELADAGGGVLEVVIGGVGTVAETVIDLLAGLVSALD